MTDSSQALKTSTPGKPSMFRRFLSLLPHLVWIPLSVYYAIGLVGFFYQPFQRRSLEIMNSGPAMSIAETVLIEHLEATFWFIAFSTYMVIFIKRKSMKAGIIWPVLFMLVCFVALGEETSWGQHYLGYSTPEGLSELNAQNEFNVHNLHIARTLNLPEDHVVHQLGFATTYLNYTFYFLCVLLWLVIPAMLNSGRYFKSTKLFRHYPRQSRQFLVLYSLSIVIFLLVDFLLFDAGELFEFTHATAGCATALSLLKSARFQT
jgi:hypothetical protein